MKYAPHIYAQALLGAIKSSPHRERDVLKGLLVLLKKNGDYSGVGKVLESAERLIAKREGGRIVEIQSARPLTKSVTDSFMKLLRKGDRVKTRVDDSLVGGVRILIDDSWSIDATLRARLQKLFKER